MKFTIYTFIFILLFCFTLHSCAGPQEEELDLAQFRQAIEEVNLKFGEAARQGDAAAVAAFYTEDAILLPPNSKIVHGKQEIKEFHSTGMKMGVKDIICITTDVFVSDDIVYEIGRFTLKVQPEGKEPFEYKGKYVAVWKHMADGSWRKNLHADI